MDELVVNGGQILAQKLEGGLHFVGSDQEDIGDLAHAGANDEFEAAVGLAVTISVGELLLEGIEGFAAVVAELLGFQAGLDDVLGFNESVDLRELRLFEFFENADFAGSVLFFIKAGLQIGDFVGGRSAGNSEGAKQRDEGKARNRKRDLIVFLLLLENENALLGLPDLSGVLVVIQVEEFLVRIEGLLSRSQLIVTESANEPSAGGGRFQFGGLIESGDGRRIVGGEIEGGSEVLPIGDIAGIELDGEFELFLGVGKIFLVEIEAAESTVELRILRSELDGLLESGDGFGGLFLGDLDVGAEAKSVGSGRIGAG